MIFCEKKQSSSGPSKLQEKLDAELKKQAATLDEETCAAASQKLAWVTKHTDCEKVGMSKSRGQF